MKNILDAICPICGYLLDEGFHRGDICPCCGNESGFSDDITRDDLNEKFGGSVIEEFSEKIEAELSKSDVLDKETAWKLLRTIWVQNECEWKYGSVPVGWNKEKGKQQLLSAGISIDEDEMK